MARLYDRRRWRDVVSPMHLKKEPLCRMCPKPVPANVVDHIIPHNEDPILFWDLKNLQSLCKSCHDSKTYYETNRSLYLPSSVKPVANEIILLCGAPASGKSTWANNQVGYTVIDLDVIKCSVSGQEMYEVDSKYLSQSIAIRNKLITNTKGNMIIIATLSNNKVRAKWRDDLGAKLIVMSTCEYDCIQRIKADKNRKDKAKHIALAKGFYKRYKPIANEHYV